jgi:hypothetical protein
MYQPSSLSPALLTKALFRAVAQLGITAELPAVMNATAEEITQLQSGERLLDPQRREWEGALKIVGLFRTIVEVLGTPERARTWLGTANESLGGRPIDLLASADATVVHRYLSSVSKHELRMPPARREH